MNGIVLKFNYERGYGFIQSIDTTEDFYFNIRNVEKGYTPQVEDRVSFTPTKGKYGKPACVDVKKL